MQFMQWGREEGELIICRLIESLSNSQKNMLLGPAPIYSKSVFLCCFYYLYPLIISDQVL